MKSSYVNLEDLASKTWLPGSFRSVFNCRVILRHMHHKCERSALKPNFFFFFFNGWTINAYHIIDNILQVLICVVLYCRVLWYTNVNQVKCKDDCIRGLWDICLKGNIWIVSWLHIHIIVGTFIFQKLFNSEQWNLLL